jgi:alcohol dehydrogenase class IV
VNPIQFEFATATRIIFGAGKSEEIGSMAAPFGKRALVVHGRDPSRYQDLLDELMQKGMGVVSFPVSGEPTTLVVREGVRQAQAEHCDVVIGIGGGSVLDTCKAIAILLANEGDVYDYLEVIGKGKSFTRLAFPWIAMPTTAGTGTEVSRNAVLGSPEHGVKVSLRSPYMLARLALVDPVLTYSLPPAVTASTGLDALTQLIEPFVCNNPNPMIDALCREGIVRAARSIRRAYQHGDDPSAREDMSLAALFSGLALANARLGAVHGFAGVLGGSYTAPHGAICARLLPCVMEINVRALGERIPQAETLARYVEVARLLTGNASASIRDGVDWLKSVVDELEIPPLGSYGLRMDALPAVIEKSARASSMKGNPIALTPDEMNEILVAAL